jgi:branched-chain amino acid transport system permease protein
MTKKKVTKTVKWLTWFRNKWFYLLVLAAALCVPFVIPNQYFFQLIMMSCLFAIATLSLNLIIGITGQVSLAHGAFFGIGAYGVAILTTTSHMSFWLALPLAAIIAALAGLIIGIPALRTRGAYFAISTLCMGFIVELVASNWIDLTGGYNGIVGVPQPSSIPIPFVGQISFADQTSQYYMVLFFLLLTIFVMHRVTYSLKGLNFMAVRNNENLAEAVGINTFSTKLLSFVVGNFFAGLAGGIYASIIGSISPSATGIVNSFNWLAYLLLGGIATMAGPIIGAFVIPLLMEYLQALQEYTMIIFGILLIVVMIFFPTGFMGGITKLNEKLRYLYSSRKGGAHRAANSGKSL